MTSSPSAVQRQTTDEDRRLLVYWLALEDIYTSKFVSKWVNQTPRDETIAVLSELAEYARAEPHSLWSMAFRGLVMLFSASETVTKNSPAGRKAGTRAALLLANMREPAAIPPLTRVFEPVGFWEGKYQQAIEEALIRVLEGIQAPELIGPYASNLRDLATCIWVEGSMKKDITPRRFEILHRIITLLKPLGGAENDRLLSSLANTKTSAPRRKQISEIADSPHGTEVSC